MRAIILSAGQGRRLLPLTADSPKCMLHVQPGVSVLSFQLRALAACGVEQASVIVGFNADQVEESLARDPVRGIEVETVYNPFYRLSDNLATAWLARAGMHGEFLLLNGDTLFEPDVLRRLLDSPAAPLTLAINEKPAYDDDDMKVSLADDGQLLAVGKTLAPEVVGGESIGLMLFRGDGPRAFRRALEGAIREPEALSLWYLSVVNGLVDSLDIRTTKINPLWWAEIDCAEDLASVRESLAGAGAGLAPASRHPA